MRRVVVAGALWVLACGQARTGAEERKGPVAPLVQVETVAPRDVRWTRAFPVTLEAAETAKVFSRASGYVVAWHVDRGDPVRRGQRLASVEREEATAQQRQAAAQLEAAKAAWVQARDNATRIDRLAQRQFVSEQERDQAQAALRVAEAQVQAAEAALKTLATRAGWTEVTAPFDGVVLERGVDVGTLVSPQGPALFTLASLARIKAVVAVPQNDAGRIALGQEGRLDIQGLEDSGGVTGRVARFAPALDPMTRTLVVEMEFENPSGLLRPGMFGRVTLLLREQQGVLVVPPQAVGRKGDRGIVYRVVDGKALRTEVTLGSMLADGSVEVLSGLSAGDRIVVAGRDLVRDGQPVRIAMDPSGGR
ncbi:MAG TPA: efflux RND transporter periplasmic adaptor subunit [Myxococcota bacterium]|nr:efflux RND transporter periplasmic adaptor subunit [Myxococcota bacterium]HQK49775.1 efflux RND transporter periplasmic adaptor subunit [Myxococcota bacterium]